MALDPHQGATLTARGDDSSSGNYHLTRVAADHYRLTGPDDRYPAKWLADEVGDGEWWTEWADSEETFVMDIRR